MADEAKTGDPVETKQRTSGPSLTWLWMILALVVVGAFLVWLGVESEPTSVVVVEADSTEAVEPGVTVVVKDTLAADKSAFEGQRIQVAEVEATGGLGPGIFWGELGDRSQQVPILIRLDSAAAEGWMIQSGALYTLTGTVNRMSDSLATAWNEAGEFRGEGEAMQAAFADYYIQTSRIRQSRAGASGGGEGGAGGTADTDPEGADMESSGG